ncbi:MAG: putative adenylate-forming enzyme [bacterium]|jgi:putative adenylate-forming enzyme
MLLADISKVLFYYARSRHLLQFSTREQIEQWQQDCLKDYIKTVLPKSPFYQKQDYQFFHQLPIMDKATMMENFDTINTANISKKEALEIALKAETSRDFSPKIGDITVGLSSGTSGNQGIFLVSDHERLKWAGTMIAKTLPPNILQFQKVAFFLRSNSNLYSTLKFYPFQFQFFDLFDDFDKLLQDLTEFSPTILVAPAQVLQMIAHAQKYGKISIDPQKIISVAEVLDSLIEKQVKNVFKKVVHQIYQCTEGFLGATCHYGNIHLNEEFIFFEKEWIDKGSRRFVPVITDFSRTTQPIVRYRLDDVLQEKKEACLCGKTTTVLEQVEGRCDDILYGNSKDKEKLIAIFPDFIRREIVKINSRIEGYRVLQLTPDRLDVFLMTDEQELFDAIKTVLQNLFKHFECLPPEVKFKTDLRLRITDKLRRVERRFPIP